MSQHSNAFRNPSSQRMKLTPLFHSVLFINLVILLLMSSKPPRDGQKKEFLLETADRSGQMFKKLNALLLFRFGVGFTCSDAAKVNNTAVLTTGLIPVTDYTITEGCYASSASIFKTVNAFRKEGMFSYDSVCHSGFQGNRYKLYSVSDLTAKMANLQHGNNVFKKEYHGAMMLLANSRSAETQYNLTLKNVDTDPAAMTLHVRKTLVENGAWMTLVESKSITIATVFPVSSNYYHSPRLLFFEDDDAAVGSSTLMTTNTSRVLIFTFQCYLHVLFVEVAGVPFLSSDVPCNTNWNNPFRFQVFAATISANNTRRLFIQRWVGLNKKYWAVNYPDDGATLVEVDGETFVENGSLEARVDLFPDGSWLKETYDTNVVGVPIRQSFLGGNVFLLFAAERSFGQADVLLYTASKSFGGSSGAEKKQRYDLVAKEKWVSFDNPLVSSLLVVPDPQLSSSQTNASTPSSSSNDYPSQVLIANFGVGITGGTLFSVFKLQFLNPYRASTTWGVNRTDGYTEDKLCEMFGTCTLQNQLEATVFGTGEHAKYSCFHRATNQSLAFVSFGQTATGLTVYNIDSLAAPVEIGRSVSLFGRQITAVEPTWNFSVINDDEAWSSNRSAGAATWPDCGEIIVPTNSAAGLLWINISSPTTDFSRLDESPQLLGNYSDISADHVGELFAGKGPATLEPRFYWNATKSSTALGFIDEVYPLVDRCHVIVNYMEDTSWFSGQWSQQEKDIAHNAKTKLIHLSMEILADKKNGGAVFNFNDVVSNSSSSMISQGIHRFDWRNLIGFVAGANEGIKSFDLLKSKVIQAPSASSFTQYPMTVLGVFSDAPQFLAVVERKKPLPPTNLKRFTVLSDIVCVPFSTSSTDYVSYWNGSSTTATVLYMRVGEKMGGSISVFHRKTGQNLRSEFESMELLNSPSWLTLQTAGNFEGVATDEQSGLTINLHLALVMRNYERNGLSKAEQLCDVQLWIESSLSIAANAEGGYAISSPSELINLRLFLSNATVGQFVLSESFGAVVVSYSGGTLRSLGTLSDTNVMLQGIRFSFDAEPSMKNLEFQMIVQDMVNKKLTVTGFLMDHFKLNDPPQLNAEVLATVHVPIFKSYRKQTFQFPWNLFTDDSDPLTYSLLTKGGGPAVEVDGLTWEAVTRTMTIEYNSPELLNVSLKLAASDGYRAAYFPFQLIAMNFPTEVRCHLARTKYKLGKPFLFRKFNRSCFYDHDDADGDLTFSLTLFDGGSISSYPWLVFDPFSLVISGIAPNYLLKLRLNGSATDGVTTAVVSFEIDFVDQSPYVVVGGSNLSTAGANNISVKLGESFLTDLSSIFADPDDAVLTITVQVVHSDGTRGDRPDWMRFSGNALSGVSSASIPNVYANFSETLHLLVVASDGYLSANSTIYFTIWDNVPVATLIPTQVAKLGADINVDLQRYFVDPDGVQESLIVDTVQRILVGEGLTSMPEWMRLTPVGSLIGVAQPEVGYDAFRSYQTTYTLLIVVTDGQLRCNTNMTLSVWDAVPVVVAPLKQQNITLGEDFDIFVNEFYDSDDTTLTYSVFQYPANGASSLSTLLLGARLIGKGGITRAGYNPSEDYVQFYVFSVRATDGYLSARYNFTMVICDGVPRLTSTHMGSTLSVRLGVLTSLSFSKAKPAAVGGYVGFPSVSSSLWSVTRVVTPSPLEEKYFKLTSTTREDLVTLQILLPNATSANASEYHVELRCTDGYLSSSQVFAVKIIPNAVPTLSAAAAADAGLLKFVFMADEENVAQIPEEIVNDADNDTLSLELIYVGKELSGTDLWRAEIAEFRQDENDKELPTAPSWMTLSPDLWRISGKPPETDVAIYELIGKISDGVGGTVRLIVKLEVELTVMQHFSRIVKIVTGILSPMLTLLAVWRHWALILNTLRGKSNIGPANPFVAAAMGATLLGSTVRIGSQTIYEYKIPESAIGSNPSVYVHVFRRNTTQGCMPKIGTKMQCVSYHWYNVFTLIPVRTGSAIPPWMSYDDIRHLIRCDFSAVSPGEKQLVVWITNKKGIIFQQFDLDVGHFNHGIGIGNREESFFSENIASNGQATVSPKTTSDSNISKPTKQQTLQVPLFEESEDTTEMQEFIFQESSFLQQGGPPPPQSLAPPRPQPHRPMGEFPAEKPFSIRFQDDSL